MNLWCQHCDQQVELPADEEGRELAVEWFSDIHMPHLGVAEDILVIAGALERKKSVLN